MTTVRRSIITAMVVTVVLSAIHMVRLKADPTAARPGLGQAPDRQRFTIAVNTSTIEAAPVYLVEAGSSGINVINGGVRNLSDAGVQAATNSETQMLLAITANPRIRMLFTLAEGHYRIIGRKSAGINSIADLRGKRIITAAQTSAHYYLFKMLGSAGVSEADVTLVNVERTDMAAAIARRDADAISMWEPEAQKALDSLGSDASVFHNVPLYREWFSLYSTVDVLNDTTKRRALVGFVRVLLDAATKVRNNPQDAIPIVARKIGQTEATVRNSWAHHAFPAALPPQMLDILTEEDRWVAKFQQRAPRAREQLATFIDSSILAEAQRPLARTP
jgi:ABC-type nitrate/sulfonate/bicarbonate transport system substrate-binding protein